MEDKVYSVYIMTNFKNTTLYTGFSTELKGRVWTHKQGLVPGFTKRYNIVKLIYYEIFDNPEAAIQREKQIKNGSRKKKIDLIKSVNPEFKDLSDSI